MHLQTQTVGPNRLFFIDNIRIIVTIFVLLHHIALTYGATQGWYYYETTKDPFAKAILNLLLSFNRACLIGIFFLIAGYFTPGSYDRKGPAGFLKDRIIRLGIPLFIFAFIMRPTLVYTMNSDILWKKYSYLENIFLFRNVGPGPLWFAELLLIFCIVYSIIRLFMPGKEAEKENLMVFPSSGSIFFFSVLLSIAVFAARIYFPANRQIFHLRPGNYPQYIAMFAAGIIAYRNGWLTNIPDSAGRLWTWAAIFFLLIFIPVFVWKGCMEGHISLFSGGLHWQALFSAMWESFFCTAMAISLPYNFKKYFNCRGTILKSMGEDSFTVYIFHPMVLVYLSYLLRDFIPDRSLLKFFIVSALGIPICFIISHYIRKLPYAKKVL